MNRSLGLLLTLASALLASRAAAQPSLTATIPISPHPVSVVVDANTHEVFVADPSQGQVVVYDATRGTGAGSIQIGGQPAFLALDQQGGRLFVGDRGTQGPMVSVVDLGSGQAQTFLPAGHPAQGIAFDPQLNQLYVGDPDGSDLMVVDGGSAQVTGRVPVDGLPAAVAIDQHTGEVAIAVQGQAPALALFDPSTRNLSAVTVPLTEGEPVQVAADNSTDKFFVARDGANPALLVLRPGSTSFDNAIPIEGGVTGLAIDSRDSRIYLSHGDADLATVVDGASGDVVATVSVGEPTLDDTSNHAAVDEGSTPTRVYMVDTASGILSVLTDQ